MGLVAALAFVELVASAFEELVAALAFVELVAALAFEELVAALAVEGVDLGVVEPGTIEFQTAVYFALLSVVDDLQLVQHVRMFPWLPAPPPGIS